MVNARTLLRMLILVASVFSSQLLAQEAKPPPDYQYFARNFSCKGGTVPTCTPFRAETSGKKVILRDPNEVWGRVTLSKTEYDSEKRFVGFDECVAAVPSYKDRYVPEHLAALSKGQLAAGMPFEFALMILGPPNQKPMLFSMINPMTGKAETYHTHMWMHLFGKMGPLRTAFSIIGTLALGVAGVTDSLGTTVDALKVASAATTAELITWEVSSLSQAKFVTIQVDGRNQIHMLMAQ